MDPCLFLPYHLSCLSHYTTRWIMSVYYLGLQICLLETSTFMVTLPFFPWCKPKWSQDDFLVHSVNTAPSVEIGQWVTPWVQSARRRKPRATRHKGGGGGLSTGCCRSYPSLKMGRSSNSPHSVDIAFHVSRALNPCFESLVCCIP